MLISSAVLPEARAIARAFHLRGNFPGRIETTSDGALGVGLVGVRALHLADITREAAPQALIMAGVAGGLDPDLHVGDVVLQAGADDGGRQHVPTMHWNSSAGQLKRGIIHTATSLVASSAEKHALFAATGALAVDMESDVAAKVAEDLRIPFLAIRGISDASSESLDPAVIGLVDAEGRPRMGAAIRLLARRPAMLSKLLRLKRATDLALLHVVAALQSVIASGWPDI